MSRLSEARDRVRSAYNSLQAYPLYGFLARAGKNIVIKSAGSIPFVGGIIQGILEAIDESEYHPMIYILPQAPTGGKPNT